MQHSLSASPMRMDRKRAFRSLRQQAGLTLIEFMVSIVIGMLMIAALATLIASQSSTRADIDKSGRLIENGRYAAQTVANDLQMAGYWGELGNQLPAPAALPDPCSVTAADLEAAMGVHVQGYDAPAVLPASLAVCVRNHMPGTDVLVVRKADPDMRGVLTGTAIDLSKVTAGQVYLQTGMDATGVTLTSVLAAGSSSASTNATAFALKKKDKVAIANLRKVVVNIYFISKCSVEVAGSCTDADGGKPIPTLKRVELIATAGATAQTTVTVAEGIENFQVDYGVDTDSDGAPNGADLNGSTLTVADWPNVVTLKVHLLARSTEVTAGFEDTKTYVMGTAGAVSPPALPYGFGYKRHLFVQSIRLTNPSSRRVL